MLTTPILTDWHSLNEMRDALDKGQLAGGMTLELSLEHPELNDAPTIDRFITYLSAYGVRVERMRGLAPTAVYLRRPA